jgi:hypothetical protein
VSSVNRRRDQNWGNNRGGGRKYLHMRRERHTQVHTRDICRSTPSTWYAVSHLYSPNARWIGFDIRNHESCEGSSEIKRRDKSAFFLFCDFSAIYRKWIQIWNDRYAWQSADRKIQNPEKLRLKICNMRKCFFTNWKWYTRERDTEQRRRENLRETRKWYACLRLLLFHRFSSPFDAPRVSMLLALS